MSTKMDYTIRKHVFKRDDYTCRACGHFDPTGATLAYDHVKPQADGGRDTKHNGQTLCCACNMRKGRLHYRFKKRMRPSPDMSIAEYISNVAANRKLVDDLMDELSLKSVELNYRDVRAKHIKAQKRYKTRTYVGEI